MFEAKVLEEIGRLQTRLAEIRQRYGSYCTSQVKDALAQAHAKIDEAFDASLAALDADRYRDVVCPQCQSKQAKLEKHDMGDWDRWSLFCPDCEYEDVDVSVSDGKSVKVQSPQF
jgi:Zn finger protein HypA/HybF involved in hydrogenase expression